MDSLANDYPNRILYTHESPCLSLYQPTHRYHPDNQIEFDDLAHPEVDDLLDDLGEWALKKGGRVVVVPAERMPTQASIAAIHRF